MNRVLVLFLDNIIRHGALEVETADGAKRTFGDGSGPPLAIRIADPGAERALMLDPELALGELYMDGRLQVTGGDLYDLVALAATNLLNCWKRNGAFRLLPRLRSPLAPRRALRPRRPRRRPSLRSCSLPPAKRRSR